MDAKKLKAIIMMGESTTVQFKERVDDAYKIGCEFVAFSNSQGGLLVVGVNDKTGEISGLTYEEIQKTSNLLSNAASDNVCPSITIMIETVLLDGISKPRNQLLFNNAVYLLPYVGIGSGIVRAFRDFKDITFENNLATEEFIVTVKRPGEAETHPKNGIMS